MQAVRTLDQGEQNGGRAQVSGVGAAMAGIEVVITTDNVRVGDIRIETPPGPREEIGIGGA